MKLIHYPTVMASQEYPCQQELSIILDLYASLVQLKLGLEIEYNMCRNNNKEKYFLKYTFIYDNIY